MELSQDRHCAMPEYDYTVRLSVCRLTGQDVGRETGYPQRCLAAIFDLFGPAHCLKICRDNWHSFYGIKFKQLKPQCIQQSISDGYLVRVPEPFVSNQRKPSVTLFAPIRKCDDSCLFGGLRNSLSNTDFVVYWNVCRVYPDDWGSRFLRCVFQCLKQPGSLL
jgi:hypothetical protein